MVKSVGIIINEVFAKSFDFTISLCAQAIPVIGEAPGVAKANCVLINRSKINPVDSMPTILAKLCKIGIIMIAKTTLFAILVTIAANSNTETIKSIGGSCVIGVTNDAIVAFNPVSALVK